LVNAEFKTDAHEKDNVWLAKSGFGGTEYLLSALYTEGVKRGLPLHRIAELTSWNPVQRYGLFSKGDLAAGFDADIVLLDPDMTFTVKTEASPSTQGYSVFENIELNAAVKATFLRGNLIFENGELIGEAHGQYLKR
jgi:allantoinase